MTRHDETARNKRVADEVLRQLGGSRFCAMTGAKQLLFTDGAHQLGGLQAKFPSLTYNGVEVSLDSRDLYTVRFFKQAGAARLFEVVKETTHHGVDCEALSPLFEQETKLRIRL